MHVLHPSLGSTLHSVVHTENSPPLWYVLEWVDSRVLGTGEVALRLPSALAGIAIVPVAWAIGRELAGRRAALGCAALVAVNPLFVWYSQEARAYGAVRVHRRRWRCSASCAPTASPPRGAAALFVAARAALALLTHYFAVFLLAPMVLWLAADARPRRAALALRRARSGVVGPRAAAAGRPPRAATARSGSAAGRCRVACRRSPSTT